MSRNAITTDGYTVKWIQREGDKSTWSTLHITARGILKTQYPTVKILEEVNIPITRRRTLYLDFYIPLYNLAIEVDGQQHYKYTKFFHGSKRKFRKSVDNDYLKEQFCDINGITLIRFKYNESIDRWRELLL